jgi:uncharacterized membrane protein YdfJ with MMPL/SSD domain
MAAPVTLLPAALGFVGPRIDRVRVGRRRPDRASERPFVTQRGFWWSWSRRVQRRPLLTGAAAVAVLVLLAAPLVCTGATPTVLQLVGRANWWFPRRLERAVPRILGEVDPQQPPPMAAASRAQ